MTRKIAFFEWWSWFKFYNLGLALGTNSKFCTSVAKGLKLKVRKFWGPNPTLVEVTGEKLVGGPFCPRPSSWTGLRNNRFEESYDVKYFKEIKSRDVFRTQTSIYNGAFLWIYLTACYLCIKSSTIDVPLGYI